MSNRRVGFYPTRARRMGHTRTPNRAYTTSTNFSMLQQRPLEISRTNTRWDETTHLPRTDATNLGPTGPKIYHMDVRTHGNTTNLHLATHEHQWYSSLHADSQNLSSPNMLLNLRSMIPHYAYYKRYTHRLHSMTPELCEFIRHTSARPICCRQTMIITSLWVTSVSFTSSSLSLLSVNTIQNMYIPLTLCK